MFAVCVGNVFVRLKKIQSGVVKHLFTVIVVFGLIMLLNILSY